MTTRDRILSILRTYPVPPTHRELAGMLRANEHTVRGHLERLRKAGRVTWEDGVVRSLRVVDKNDTAI